MARVRPRDLPLIDPSAVSPDASLVVDNGDIVGRIEVRDAPDTLKVPDVVEAIAGSASFPKMSDGASVQDAIAVAPNPAALLASMDEYPVGSTIRTADGFLYRVADPSAMDNHLITVGGVKLYLVPQNGLVSVTACGAIGNGLHDDTNAVQKAFNAAVDIGADIDFPSGVYVIEDSIDISGFLSSGRKVFGHKATLKTTSDIDVLSASGNGYPGGFEISGLSFEGPGDDSTARAIVVDGNIPFGTISRCRSVGFEYGVYLRDAYCTTLRNVDTASCKFGFSLNRDSHACTLINCMADYSTEAGLAVNYGGGDGTGALQNLTVVGGAYQNGKSGIWLENTYSPTLLGLYYEGNTSYDIRVGVDDGGAYGRSVFAAHIYSFQTSSPCSDPGGANIVVQHSVGVEIRGAQFQAGTPASSAHVYVDSWSDKVLINVDRVNSSNPFSIVDPSRVIVERDNQRLVGAGNVGAYSFYGNGGLLSRIGQGTLPISGRTALIIESLIEDVVVRGKDILRLGAESSGDWREFVHVDGLNDLVRILRGILVIDNLPNSAASVPIGGIWRDDGAGGVVKQRTS